MGNIDFPIRESSIAKWLERRPLKPGVNEFESRTIHFPYQG